MYMSLQETKNLKHTPAKVVPKSNQHSVHMTLQEAKNLRCTPVKVDPIFNQPSVRMPLWESKHYGRIPNETVPLNDHFELGSYSGFLKNIALIIFTPLVTPSAP